MVRLLIHVLKIFLFISVKDRKYCNEYMYYAELIFILDEVLNSPVLPKEKTYY